MNNSDKRKIVLNWKIAGERVFCVSSYYKALLYLNSLRLQGVKDIHAKPILTKINF